MSASKPALLAALALPILLKLISNTFRTAPRPDRIPLSTERVVVLGASSGIGRAIANQYARRGARVCVVGRRAGELEEVRRECEALQLQGWEERKNGSGDLAGRTLAIVADIAVPEDMIRLRDRLQKGTLNLICPS